MPPTARDESRHNAANFFKTVISFLVSGGSRSLYGLNCLGRYQHTENRCSRECSQTLLPA